MLHDDMHPLSIKKAKSLKEARVSIVAKLWQAPVLSISEPELHNNAMHVMVHSEVDVQWTSSQ